MGLRWNCLVIWQRARRMALKRKEAIPLVLRIEDQKCEVRSERN